MTTRSRRTYDHRIKEQIILTGNPDLFPELEIPRSTALSWIRRGMGEVISLDDQHELEAALRNRIVNLENRISMLDGGAQARARSAAGLWIQARALPGSRCNRQTNHPERCRTCTTIHAAVGSSSGSPTVVGSLSRVGPERRKPARSMIDRAALALCRSG